ncbi:MAG TPA: hypothetical protein VKZ63_11205 [Kofleriaceae bacterium]|nr:hypothetical protein [Kofleriaceae bacterium]
MPGSLRVVILHSGELLRSEERALKGVRKALTSRKGATMAEASAEEATAARALLSGQAGAGLPPAWRTVETVVVLEVLPPAGKAPRRTSQGLGGVLVLRPPTAAPFYREVVDPAVGAHLGGEKLTEWIRDLAALEPGGSK